MISTRKVETVVALVIAGLLLARPLSAEELTGKGEWQSLSSDAISGTWSVSLTKSGTTVKGKLALTGSNVFTGGEVTGTLDAASVALGVVSEQGKQASFSGKLDGDVISGEWQSAVIGDHGVWYGTFGKQ